MYAPKIRDDLIQKLYHLAKVRGIPTTRLVNELLEAVLNRTQGEVNDSLSSYRLSEPKSKKRR